MKRNILTALLAAAAAFSPAYAAQNSNSITMIEGMVNVNLDFDIDELNVKSNETMVLTPYLVNEGDTLFLPSLGVYGRNSWIQRERGASRIPEEPAMAIRAKDHDTYKYHTVTKYREWFDGMKLSVREKRYGCAACNKGVATVDDIDFWNAPNLNFASMLTFEQAEVETVKERNISGRANVEFPVNKTILLEDFRGNHAELARITAGIDSVRNDKDVTIESILIKGFASPEGAYANNERLASGRTQSLKDYVQSLYSFAPGIMKTAWEAEDWNGLRTWVEKSNIANRDGILAIINDKNLAPDARDQRIRTKYPQEYSMLLNTVYPSLRHSEYLIKYIVRSYSNPEEILAVMKTRPGNLSLDEFLIAAKSLKPGSPEYNEVFETAVRMYPDSPVANYNAANTAISRGLWDEAAAYLSKCGDSPKVTFSKGVVAAGRKDFDTARSLLTVASQQGIANAESILGQLDRYEEYVKLQDSITPEDIK